MAEREMEREGVGVRQRESKQTRVTERRPPPPSKYGTCKIVNQMLALAGQMLAWLELFSVRKSLPTSASVFFFFLISLEPRVD